MPDAASPISYFGDRARRLHSLPAVALEVLDLTSRPNLDLRAIRNCIEKDPALTSKILRVVNSALFGLSREVSDLNQALALLGIKPLKLLVLGFSLSQAVPGDHTGPIMARYWRHTLTQAIAAREISEVLLHQSGDEAFIAGLLEDIGMLVLLQELGEPYSRLLERILETKGDIVQWELSALGFDHTSLSARLLEHWSLPRVLVEGVRANCRVNVATNVPPSTGIAGVLHVARLLADLLVDGRAEALASLQGSVLDHHRLDSEHLQILTASLDEKVAQLADVLSVDLPPGQSYSEVLARAHAQLSQTAAEAACELLGGREDPDEEEAEAVLRQMNALRTAVEQVIRGDSAGSSHFAAAAADNASAVAHVGESWDAGPASDPGELLQALRKSVTECRAQHTALSLILVEISSADDMLIAWGPVEADLILRTVHRICRTMDARVRYCLRTRETQFALLLPDCDRRQAVEFGRHVLRTVRNALHAHADTLCGLRVSVGAATVHSPAKNFWPDDLVERAERCLRAAQLAGGNTVKSIGVT